MNQITAKSIKMTSYLDTLLNKIKNLVIINPSETEKRGAQLSVRIKKFDKCCKFL